MTSIVDNESAKWKRMTPEEKDQYVSRLLDELSEEDDDQVADSDEENEVTIQAEDIIYASDEEHEAVFEVQSESESDSEYEDELSANTGQEYYVSKDGNKVE
uniref:Uncharacterized protein n=1 Tax=Cacopsylla melanoneura TaxID=428564 RepID=A0A8D9E8T6_9HEMI